MLCSSVFLPVRDNLLSDGQRATLVLTVRYRDSHHSLMLKLFPIGAPSARIVSPSASHSRTTSVGALLRSLFNFASSWPSLLSMFSFMPVASSHTFRILFTAGWSPGASRRVVSSAYWLIMYRVAFIFIPFISLSGDCMITLVRGSVISRKRRGLSGQPCAHCMQMRSANRGATRRGV